jgi:hypothetical protein
MKLPFVSRAMHEETLMLVKEALDGERATSSLLRRQLADLQGKYHQLTLSGATPAAPAPLPLAEAPSPDPVLRAILARSGTDMRKRSMMLEQARRDRAKAIPDEEILKMIEEGIPTDGMPS